MELNDDSEEIVPVNRPGNGPPARKPPMPPRFSNRPDQLTSRKETPLAPLTPPKPRDPAALAEALARILPKPTPAEPPARPTPRASASVAATTKKASPAAPRPVAERPAKATAPPASAPAPAARLVAPEAAAAPPTRLPEGQAQTTIRTMQDDVSDVQQGRVLPLATSDSAATPVPGAAQVDSSRRTLPLKPTASGRQQKVVTVPAARRRRGRVIWWTLSGLAVVVLVGGAGAAAWWYLGETPTDVADEQVAAAAQVLPQSAMLILQYRLESAEARTEIGKVWGKSGVPAQLSNLITGDPRLLLNDPELKEFFYVMLEDATRPYLIVPVTPEVTRLVAAGSEVRFIQKDGWYIVHALATQPYEQALGVGTLATTPTASFLNEAGTQPLRLVLGPNALPQLRTSVAGEHFVAGEISALHLAGSINQTQATINLSGSATTLTTLSTGAADVALLGRLPEQATVVRLGSTFAEDVRNWVGKAGVVDNTALARPVVQQLLTKLTTPYAYFAYTGPRADENVGLLIALPPELQGGKIALGDIALEEALPALLPLILDQRQIAPIAYADATYAGIAMRYAKISGTPYALNYAVTPTHVLVATSKESMFALVDTVAGNTPSVATGTTWQALLAASAEAPGARDIVVGQLRAPVLTELLPRAAVASSAIPFSLSLLPSTTGTKASATLLLSSTPTTSPVPTATIVSP